MKTVVIYNPSSGKGRGEEIASTVEQYLTQRGLEVELRATCLPKDAMRIAQRCAARVETIVAVGGDGTVNEVVNGMASARASSGAEPRVPGTPATKHSPTLGIVPAGTVNVLALELNLPFQVERACGVIAGGNTVSLDLGRVNERRFILMMGAGIDALTVRKVDPKAKRYFRQLAFVATGLTTGLARRPQSFLACVDGHEYPTTFFVAGNSRYYADRFAVTPRADPTDGLLDLLLFTGTTRSSLAVFWMGVPSGRHIQRRNTVYLRTRRADLTPLDERHVVWYQTDGELAGRLPATVEIEPHALDVLVP